MLKTNYIDALFNGQRQYKILQNQDGTSTIVDATTYTQEGDKFGANDINETNSTVNALLGVKTVHLSVSGWGATIPYTQTVQVAGVRETDNPQLVKMLPDGVTLAKQKEYEKAYGIISAGTGITRNGEVTFKVYKLPTVGITVGLKGV